MQCMLNFMPLIVLWRTRKQGSHCSGEQSRMVCTFLTKLIHLRWTWARGQALISGIIDLDIPIWEFCIMSFPSMDFLHSQAIKIYCVIHVPLPNRIGFLTHIHSIRQSNRLKSFTQISWDPHPLYHILEIDIMWYSLMTLLDIHGYILSSLRVMFYKFLLIFSIA